MYYFAYGSNMNHKQMKTRCPSSHFVRRVLLKKYKFVYDGYSDRWKGAVANIVESEKNIVYGGLFQINEDNLAALDCYEGYPCFYDRRQVTVEDECGKTYETWTYLRTGKLISKPSEKYRRVVIQGAQDCGLPEKYIKTYLEQIGRCATDGDGSESWSK